MHLHLRLKDAMPFAINLQEVRHFASPKLQADRKAFPMLTLSALDEVNYEHLTILPESLFEYLQIDTADSALS